MGEDETVSPSILSGVRSAQEEATNWPQMSPSCTAAAAAAVPAVVPAMGCFGGGGGNNPNPSYTSAVITGAPYNLACPGTTILDGAASTSADGGPLMYSWTFSNDVTGEVSVPTDPSTQATYQLSADANTPFQLGASYTVSLTVTDSTGEAAQNPTIAVGFRLVL